jgi:hypothetical protein
MKVVRERLGHPTISVTMDVYSHVTPGMATDAARIPCRAVLTAAVAGLFVSFVGNPVGIWAVSSIVSVAAK